MTAEQFIQKYGCNSKKDIRECLIEFAKYHVEQALIFASVNAELSFTNSYRSCEISTKSIIESYNLDNIQ